MQLPRRRVLLSVLATLVLSYHATTTPAAAAVTTCAPKTCGNITLSYPFWQTDAAQPSTPCGPSAFQVDCLAGGRASLSRSFRGGYKLLRVSYADRTVVVANDNVQTNASGCPVPTIDVSASLSLAPFSASAAANRQLFFLFNCTPPPAPGFVDVMCSSTQAVVRLDAAYNTTAARATARRCSYAVVPVVGSLSPGGNAGMEYPRLLSEGYVLQWRASPGDCGACGDSGGQCGYDSNADAFACVCADGSSHPARCGLSPRGGLCYGSYKKLYVVPARSSLMLMPRAPAVLLLGTTWHPMPQPMGAGNISGDLLRIITTRRTIVWQLQEAVRSTCLPAAASCSRISCCRSS